MSSFDKDEGAMISSEVFRSMTESSPPMWSQWWCDKKSVSAFSTRVPSFCMFSSSTLPLLPVSNRSVFRGVSM